MAGPADAYNDAFATAIGAAPAGQMPQLPTLPGQKRPTIAQRARQPNRLPTIDEVMPSRRDEPQFREITPRQGDEGLIMSPDDPDNPIPSTPRQGTQGDTARDWPQPVSQRRSAPPQAPAEVRAAIEQAAREAGQSPAYGLAVASRESSFDPNAGGTGSIKGLFQMTGANRAAYGVADDANALDQARGFYRFTGDLRNEMAARLGRQPTDTEAYLGHYFGGSRAARMITGMDPGTPVSEVFTPRELATNPNLQRLGTVGNVIGDTQGDMAHRMQAYGRENPGQNPGNSGDAQPQETAQFAGDQQPTSPAAAPLGTSQGTPPVTADFSTFGTPAQEGTGP